MPLVRISLVKGKPAEHRRKVGDAVHRALVETINVPPLDRFQLLTEHEPGDIVYDSNYLGIARSSDIVIVQITLSVGRTLEQKRASLRASMDSPTMAGVRLAAERAGNDFARVMESSLNTHPVPSFEEMAAVTCPVLFILGEDDFVGPVERLLEAVPDARLVTLRRTDHFSTTQRLEAQEATLRFLGEG